MKNWLAGKGYCSRRSLGDAVQMYLRRLTPEPAAANLARYNSKTVRRRFKKDALYSRAFPA